MKDYTYNGRSVSLSFHWTLKIKLNYTSRRNKKSVERIETFQKVLGADKIKAIDYWHYQIRKRTRSLIEVLEATREQIAFAFYNDDDEREFLNRYEQNELYKTIQENEKSEIQSVAKEAAKV